ncbi:MAG: hypothetical protein JWP08_4018, partial [Bryobacterales bacterium]|nr:hypothetical protein [Bryobacterales bacterium]
QNSNPRSRLKLCRVVSGPVEKGPCGRTCDVCDFGRDERRLAHCGSPRVEQHSRNDSWQFTARVVRRDLLDLQRAAEHATDRSYLLVLAQRLGPGQNILRSGVPVVARGADPDCGNIMFVDRGCRSTSIGCFKPSSAAGPDRPPGPGNAISHSSNDNTGECHFVSTR